MASISLDFPHGAARLLVRRDGETHLFYGTLPASRIIAGDTFDIDELYDDLQNRIHKMVPAEKRPLGQPSGMVTIGFIDVILCFPHSIFYVAVGQERHHCSS